MLAEPEIKQLTTEPIDEHVSILVYAFGRKMHFQISHDLAIENIDEVAQSIKERIILDFKDFRKGNTPSSKPYSRCSHKNPIRITSNKVTKIEDS